MDILVVDYGMGNLRSVSKALEKVGFRVKVSSDPEDVKKAKAIVLPGVGAFRDAVENLKRMGLYGEIELQKEKRLPKVPLKSFAST